MIDISQMQPLVDAGYDLIPLHRFNKTDSRNGKTRSRGKSPIDKNWTSRDYNNQSVLKQAGKNENNVGVRLTAQQLVIDVDPRAFPDGQTLETEDNPFAQFCKDYGITQENFPTVITGSGGLHVYMSKPVNLSTKEGLREYPGVEFKSAGRQVVAPGSRHPDTKELYKWDINSVVLDEFGADSAPRILLDDLEKKIATAHIPTEEMDVTLLPQEVEAVLKAIGEIDNYDEWVKILMACHMVSGGMALSECQDWSFESDRENVATKWTSFSEHGNSGGQVGWGTLKYYAGLYGGQNALQVCDDIERGDPADDFDVVLPDDLPDGAKPPTEFVAPEVIWKVRDGILRETADLAEQAISQSPKHIYKRGSLLVTPKSADKAGMPTYLSTDEAGLSGGDVSRDAGSTILARVSPAHLTEILGDVVRWRKIVKMTRDDKIAWVEKHGDDKKPPNSRKANMLPPRNVVETILGRPEVSGIPKILAVYNSPVILPNGSIVQVEGYHESIEALVDFRGVTFPSIPDKPSKEDALKALDLLLAPFAAYEFQDASSKGVAISGILSAISRPLLPNVPLHAVSSSTPGAGKTQLAQCWAIAATGNGASVLGQSERQEELTKRLESLLMAGDRAAIIDNCSRVLGGDTLNMLLTETSIKIRVLGSHDEVDVPTNIFLAATGNHFQVKDDTVRRVVVCTVKPQGENPEETAFSFNPKEEMAKNRAGIVTAALTIMKAHIVAGRPASKTTTPLGSFENWSRLCRDPIIWLLGQEHDPCKTIQAQRRDDPVAMERAELLGQIQSTVGIDTPFQAKEISKRGGDEISENSWNDLYDLLVLRTGKPGWQGQAIGGVLTRSCGRSAAGLVLEKSDERDRNGTFYVLREMSS